MRGLNLLAAVAVGVAQSMFLFVRHNSRSIVARVYRGGRHHSTVMRVQASMDLLRRYGEEIALVELEGPLFFGSGDLLMDELERLAATTRTVILDFRQVSGVEMSGAAALQRSALILGRRGVLIYLAGIAPERSRGQAIVHSSLVNRLPAEHWFADADLALEAAEDALLSRHGVDVRDDATLAWADMEVLAGLSEAQLQILVGHGQRMYWQQGDILFSCGEAGDTVYLLAAGRVEISLPVDGGRGNQRLVALRPGLAFGEIAVLRGAPRSADAVVASPQARTLALTARSLADLRENHPEIAMALFRNIGLQMAARMASLTEEIRYARG